MWLACTGALIAIVLTLYLVLGGERPAQLGFGGVSGSRMLASADLAAAPAA
jgi:hypothetical protein